MSDNINEAPSLSRVIKEAIDARLSDLHVALPASVETYNASNQTVSVKPLIKKKYKTGRITDLPVINNVPVMFLRTNTAFITFPVKKGDTGLLIFCERSIDLWKVSGGSADPKDKRMHHLSDGVFYPGLYPLNDNIAGDTGSIVIQNNNMKIKVNPDGTVSLGNGTNELISIISEFIQAVIDAKVNTSSGPQPLLGANFPSIKNKLDTLKE